MQKARQALDKTVKQERRTAQALSDAQHKHDLAVADEHKAANDLSVRILIVITLCQPVLTILRCVAGLFPTTDASEAPSGSQSSHRESAC